MFYRNKIDNITLNGGKYNCFLYFNTIAYRKNLKRSGQLILELKVHLDPDNTTATLGPFPDNNNMSFKTGPWPPNVLRRFRKVYQQTGQNFWDNKFILTNNDYSAFDLYFSKDRSGQLVDRTKFEVPNMITADTFVNGVKTTPEEHNWQLQHNIYFSDDSPPIISVHPDVECRFLLRLVDTAGEAHTSIKLSYFTHFKTAGGRFRRIFNGEPTYFRSNSGHYSQSDILPEMSFFNGRVLIQNTHIHEIGHAIGLDHSGKVLNEPQCATAISTGDQNARVCYGTTFKSASNILGRGNSLLPFNAEPWKHAIKQMTKSDSWRVRLK